MVWVFIGDRESRTRSTSSCPRSSSTTPPSSAAGSRPRDGNWRFRCENGFDEGHAKYLHRTSLWRLFKAMPAWNKIQIERARPLDLPGARTSVHWEAEFPGLGPLDEPALVQDRSRRKRGPA